MPRELKPCGTLAAYRRHLAHGEPTCRACCDAAAAAVNARRPPPTRRGPYGKPKCGTTSGYEAHKRRREPYCVACCAAKAEYQRQWQAKRAEKRLRAAELDRLLAEAWAEVSA